MVARAKPALEPLNGRLEMGQKRSSAEEAI
jgi:hypothetical protein